MAYMVNIALRLHGQVVVYDMGYITDVDASRSDIHGY